MIVISYKVIYLVCVIILMELVICVFAIVMYVYNMHIILCYKCDILQVIFITQV